MDDWITIRYDPKDMIPIDDFEEVKKLLEKGFVDFSAKRGRAETFHITKAGLEEIESVGQSVLEDEE
mgnify:CR=1 FL=1